MTTIKTKTLASMYFANLIQNVNGTVTAVDIEKEIGHTFVSGTSLKERQYKISQWLQASAKSGLMKKAHGERMTKANAWNIYTRPLKSPLLAQPVQNNAFTVLVK